MTTASDAKNLAEELRSSIALTHLWATTLENKIAVLQAEGTNTASLTADLRAIKAARLSLLARIIQLRAALEALVPTLRPLKLVPTDSGQLSFRTANEGDRPSWNFDASFDPEGTYTFTGDTSPGLEVKWAKITAEAPDLENVFFGATRLPWLLWPVANFSVTADVEYEYEFWLEAPDGRRSDIDTQQSGDDGQPIPIEQRTGKILVRDTSTPPPVAGYLTSPTTLRRAQGVYIGSSFADITSRLEGYYASSKLNIAAPGSLGWYHKDRKSVV